MDKWGKREEIKRKIYENTKRIRACLHETGGDINIAKSAWGIFPVREEEHDNMTLERMPFEVYLSLAIVIEIKPSMNTEEILNQQHHLHIPFPKMDATTPRRSLGFRNNMIGTTYPSETQINKENYEFLHYLSRSRLFPSSIIKAYRQCHLPKITYMLHGSTPSKSFLLAETDRVTSAIFPRLGLNRNTPKAIRHAPKDRLGLNIPHLYLEMGKTMIK